jgi:hypothetical protein
VEQLRLVIYNCKIVDVTQSGTRYHYRYVGCSDEMLVSELIKPTRVAQLSSPKYRALLLLLHVTKCSFVCVECNKYGRRNIMCRPMGCVPYVACHWLVQSAGQMTVVALLPCCYTNITLIRVT